MLIENGAVNPVLMQLASQVLGIYPEANPLILNRVLQDWWVKAKEGVLRAQLGGRFPTEDELTLLKQLGMVDTIKINEPKKYRGTLVLGATLKAVVRRVKFMFDEGERMGVPQPIYLLGSSRKLDPKLEMPKHVPAILEETGARFDYEWEKDARTPYSWPLIESEMMDRVIVWMELEYREIGPRWEIKTVSAPDSIKLDGSPRPANTTETVKEWTKRVYQTGHWLVVSSQPFCQNQLLAVERAANEADPGYDEHDPERTSMTFDVCGPAAPPLPLSRWLDNLAKQLWEEVQLLPK